MASDDSSDDYSKNILDPLSPLFDPRKALYTNSPILPVARARQFNNLNEFENFLGGKDAKTLKASNIKKKTEKCGASTLRQSAKEHELQRKEAILKISSEKAGSSKEQFKQPPKRRDRSVFTRMEGKLTCNTVETSKSHGSIFPLLRSHFEVPNDFVVESM